MAATGRCNGGFHGSKGSTQPSTASGNYSYKVKRVVDRFPTSSIADFHESDHGFQLKSINAFSLGDRHRSGATLACLILR